MNLLNELNINFFIVTGLLILFGLFLEKWEPPIKKQYIAIAVFIAGGLLGWFMINHWTYGVLIAGLVYYKRELTLEIKEIKDSFVGIKDEIKDIE